MALSKWLLSPAFAAHIDAGRFVYGQVLAAYFPK